MKKLFTILMLLMANVTFSQSINLTNGASSSGIHHYNSGEKIFTNESFEFTFEADFGSQESGGHGIVAGFHNDSRGINAIGCKFDAMGWGTSIDTNNCDGGYAITPSIGIEFDIHQTSSLGDPINDHIALIEDGNTNHGNSYTEVSNLESGGWRDITIVYDYPTTTLSVYIKGSLIQSYDYDLYAKFGSSVYLAISGASGSTSTTLKIKSNLNLTYTTVFPLQLCSFNVHENKNNNIITWSTCWEKNVSHFELETSIDGVNYMKIATVDASGNSDNTNFYSYSNLNITSSKNYYRLKMIDFDGTFTYSDVIASNNIVDNMYLDISNDTITINNVLGQYYEAIILTQLGSIIYQYSGSENNTISISNNTNGIYFVIISQNKSKKTIKVIKRG